MNLIMVVMGIFMLLVAMTAPEYALLINIVTSDYNGGSYNLFYDASARIRLQCNWLK